MHCGPTDNSAQMDGCANFSSPYSILQVILRWRVFVSSDLPAARKETRPYLLDTDPQVHIQLATLQPAQRHLRT